MISISNLPKNMQQPIQLFISLLRNIPTFIPSLKIVIKSLYIAIVTSKQEIISFPKIPYIITLFKVKLYVVDTRNTNVQIVNNMPIVQSYKHKKTIL